MIHFMWDDLYGYGSYGDDVVSTSAKFSIECDIGGEHISLIDIRPDAHIRTDGTFRGYVHVLYGIKEKTVAQDFKTIDEAKVWCETTADDIVKSVYEGLRYYYA